MEGLIIGILAYLLLNNKKIADRIALFLMIFATLFMFIFSSARANAIICAILIILFPTYFLIKVIEEDDNYKLNK